MYKIYLNDKCFYDDREENKNIRNLVLKFEENKAGTFKFEILPDHPYYAAFKKLVSIVSVKQNETIIFRGRVISSEETYFGEKSIECEGVFAFFNDSIVYPFGYEDEGGSTKYTPLELFTNIIETHNSQVEKTKQFIQGTVTIEGAEEKIPYLQSDYESGMTAMTNLLKECGGRIEFVHNESGTLINWTDTYLPLNQPVEFGLNLLDVTQKVHGDEIITGILPTGETDERTTFPTNISAMDIPETELHKKMGHYIINKPLYEEYGAIIEQRSYDGYPGDWINQVLSDVDSLTGLANSIELSALDLAWLNDVDFFSLGRSVIVHSPVHGINGTYNITKMSLDLQKPDKNKFSFGKVIPGFVEQIIDGNGNKVEGKSSRTAIEYIYEYANAEIGSDRPVDSNFGKNVEFMDGMDHWVKVTSKLIDGSTTAVYYKMEEGTKRFKISGPQVISRDDRRGGEQTLSYHAEIAGYSKAHPRWFVNGKIHSEGQEIILNIPYLNPSPIIIDLYDGNIIKDTITPVIDDVTLKENMYAGASENEPESVTDEKGNILNLKPGDHYLHLPDKIPYVWDGAHFVIANDAENQHQILANSLNDAVLAPGTVSTISALYGWFKNFAATNAFIDNLQSKNVKVTDPNKANGMLVEMATRGSDGKAVCVVKYGNNTVFQVDPETGNIFFGQPDENLKSPVAGFMYDPVSNSISGPSDKFKIRSDGAIGGDAIQFLAQMYDANFQYKKKLLEDQEFVYFDNSMSGTTIVQKIDSLFSKNPSCVYGGSSYKEWTSKTAEILFTFGVSLEGKHDDSLHYIVKETIDSTMGFPAPDGSIIYWWGTDDKENAKSFWLCTKEPNGTIRKVGNIPFPVKVVASSMHNYLYGNTNIRGNFKAANFITRSETREMPSSVGSVTWTIHTARLGKFLFMFARVFLTDKMVSALGVEKIEVELTFTFPYKSMPVAFTTYIDSNTNIGEMYGYITGLTTTSIKVLTWKTLPIDVLVIGEVEDDKLLNINDWMETHRK